MCGMTSFKLIPVSNSTIEDFFVESKLKKKKWLLCFSYNPHRRFISNHLIDIGQNLDLLSTIMIISSKFFNTEAETNFRKEFCNLYGMKSLIRVSTCNKNPANPACIDMPLKTLAQSILDYLIFS